MQRDMELTRKILFKIEETVSNVVEYNLKIEGYTMEQIAYHCSLLYDSNLIYDYSGQYAGGELYSFGVGRLTWEGHEFLDKIRSDTVWNRTKEVITKQGLPMVIDVVKSISTTIISAMVEGAVKGLSQQS